MRILVDLQLLRLPRIMRSGKRKAPFVSWASSPLESPLPVRGLNKPRLCGHLRLLTTLSGEAALFEDKFRSTDWADPANRQAFVLHLAQRLGIKEVRSMVAQELSSNL